MLLILEDLEAGFAVFYRSTGSSMWPLVQSHDAHDACTPHPIHAVTAEVTDESIEYRVLRQCLLRDG